MMSALLIIAGIVVWPEMCLAAVLMFNGNSWVGMFALLWAFVRLGGGEKIKVVEKVKVVERLVGQKMTRTDAYACLGLQPGAPRDAVKTAYRDMIGRVHPDRGGSVYLAAQVNTAKELLLP